MTSAGEAVLGDNKRKKEATKAGKKGKEKNQETLGRERLVGTWVGGMQVLPVLSLKPIQLVAI